MALRLKNVLISDEVDQKCVDILRANGIAVEKNTKLSKDELIAEIPVSEQSSDTCSPAASATVSDSSSLEASRLVGSLVLHATASNTLALARVYGMRARYHPLYNI